MQSDTGITIAFIAKGSCHPTSINFNKFGTEYWDDDKYNSSKKGYYFIFYYKKQAVIIHKVNRILETKDRPIKMEWKSDRQILCLSPVLKRYEWNDWITGVGKGCPFSNSYGSTRTTSWTFDEIKSRYISFNYRNFMERVDSVIVKAEPKADMPKADVPKVDAPKADTQKSDSEDEEVIFERERRLRQQKQDEEDKQTLMKIRERKMRQNIQSLREETINIVRNKNLELQKQIDLLTAEQYKNEREIYIILKGERDEEILSDKIRNL
jgi:hypothetical protein